MIYIVTIEDFEDECLRPWISAFSTQEQAEAFMAEAQDLLKQYGAEERVGIVINQTEIDSTLYLDRIEERYNLDGPA